MEQELWTLTLKGDDIEAYKNRFHKLALMCLNLVTTEKKKIERYIQGPSERVKANVTSLKPTNLHDTINMARKLVEQAVQGKAPRISEDTSYEVELTDGKVVITNTVLHGCTLALFNHLFKIDILPTRLGSFDVIVGMNWLSHHRAVIACYEKIVHVLLLSGKILEIQGERPEKDSRSLSCMKADEKKVKDILIVRDFTEVFLDDLSGLPPVREIEFHNDLIPSALLVVKSPYRLAPFEILELSNQLKELLEKGFIRPSHSP
nr:putative reverse transcriptase domain-containing protein [Tanacetum cinerariifolium]